MTNFIEGIVGVTGPIGPQGPTGSIGPQGVTGTQGSINTIISSATYHINPSTGSHNGNGSSGSPWIAYADFLKFVGAVARFSGVVKLMIDKDLTSNDPVIIPSSWIFDAGAQIILYGEGNGAPQSEQILQSGAVTAYTSENIATNVRMKLTDSSISSWPIGQRIVFLTGVAAGAQCWTLKAVGGDVHSVYITKPIKRDPSVGGFAAPTPTPGDTYRIIAQRQVPRFNVGRYTYESGIIIASGLNTIALVGIDASIDYPLIDGLVEFNGCRVQQAGINRVCGFINTLFDGTGTGGGAINMFGDGDPEGSQMLAGGWLNMTGFSVSGTFKTVFDPQVESCGAIFPFSTPMTFIIADHMGIWNSTEFLTANSNGSITIHDELGLGCGLWGTGNIGRASLVVGSDGQVFMGANAVLSITGGTIGVSGWLQDFIVSGAYVLPTIGTTNPYAYGADIATSFTNLLGAFGRNAIHPPTGARITAVA